MIAGRGNLLSGHGGRNTARKQGLLMSEEFEVGAEEVSEYIAVIAADVTRDGLVVHFSDETTSLFSPSFLYQARKRQENTPLIEQGCAVPGSPIAEALDEEG
jgi:hypothetical protein